MKTSEQKVEIAGRLCDIALVAANIPYKNGTKEFPTVSSFQREIAASTRISSEAVPFSTALEVIIYMRDHDMLIVKREHQSNSNLDKVTWVVPQRP